MCGISGIELALIVVVALVVVGPERLPDLLRAVARFAGQMRGVTEDLQRVTRDIREGLPTEELRRELRRATDLDTASGDAPARRERLRDSAAEAEIDAIRARRVTRPAAGQVAQGGGEAPRPGASTPAEGPPTLVFSAADVGEEPPGDASGREEGGRGSGVAQSVGGGGQES